MYMLLCSKCKKEIKPGKNFCGYCGTPVNKKERRCHKCNELLDDEEIYCPMCGEKYSDSSEEKSIQYIPVIDIEENNLIKATIVKRDSSLSFTKYTPEHIKKVVKVLKNECWSVSWYDSLFLHNKEEKMVFARRKGYSYIEGYSYSNNRTLVPLRKYTVSEEVDYVWRTTIYAREYACFFHNLDAFFSWDGYIFLSVYNGRIAWSAADRRNEGKLPNKKADVNIYKPGVPELEFLPNGNIRCSHFYDNAECKLVNGVLIPV